MSNQFQDIQNRGKPQDPQIQIEALEPDPTRRGYTQIPNYFLYYWVPLIGHKAAMTYEMILSFAHGDRDTCRPSLNRLCAHLGMTRQELIGRKRETRRGKEIKEYHKKGTLEILQDHGLLFIEANGSSPYAQSYIFKILKNPPLLAPEQFSKLSKLLQESHQKLVERCKDDRVKTHNFQSSKRGVVNDYRGGVVIDYREEEKGVVNDYPNKTTTIRKEQQQQNESRPTPHPVVVSIPLTQGDPEPKPLANLSPDAGALPNTPARDNTSSSPNRESTSAPAAPTPPIHCGSIFAPHAERIAQELVPRYEADLVQQYVDWLEFQYRDRPPRKPLALLASSLAKKSLLRPEGFKSREELEKERMKKARRQEAARQEEERQRQEAQAHQRRLAQAQALFESLTEGEKEPYWKQAALEMPEFLRSKRSFVESQAQWLFFKERMRGSVGF